MKEVRVVTSRDLRGLCVENLFYTLGDNEEYDNLLRKADECKNLTTEIIEELARDILEHSETEYTLPVIMSLIARKSSSYFID